ncbi:MAG: hypothetical protein WA151_14945 [Desulfatirhabdiaceae bacterium]
MKPFVYLIQSEARMPYDNLPDENNDIILLTWGVPSNRPGSLFYPESSWNEGRNRLLAEALGRVRKSGENYLYFIFLDEDIAIKEDTDLAKRLGIPLTGNPFRTFEACLLEWEPAVGYTRYSWQHTEPDCEVNLGYNFDAMMNAFHWESLSVLLPYYTGFDAESWLYSQHLINHLCTLLYHFHRIQFNVILTQNKNRRAYSQRKRHWHIPATFLANAITSNLVDRLNLINPNTVSPESGHPLKKQNSYTVAETTVKTHFDGHHPFLYHRQHELDRPQTPMTGPHRRFAVCMSGSCRGLSKTWKNIRDNLLSRLPEYDLFIAAPDDSHAHHAGLLNPAGLCIEADSPIDETSLINRKNCMLKTGVQKYLQQLNGLKQVSQLQTDHARETGKVYDAIIRCRPDVMYVQPVENLAILDLRYLYSPDFHQFDGMNDRFAVGRPCDMDVYMNKLDEFHEYVTDWFRGNPNAPMVSAEMFTAGHLRNHGIRVRTLPVHFNRVRDHGVKHDVPVK